MVEEANNQKHPNGRFSLADPRGGITLTDNDGMITNTVKQLAKNLVSSLMSGQLADILKMRTPAYVHSKRSYLDAFVGEIGYIEGILLLMKEKNLLDDKVERLKYMTVANLATISYAIFNNGLQMPLNPILGETICRKTQRGSTLYCEQTSHHPPISHFLLEGPPELPFRMHGYCEFKV